VRLFFSIFPSFFFLFSGCPGIREEDRSRSAGLVLSSIQRYYEAVPIPYYISLAVEALSLDRHRRPSSTVDL